MIIWYIMVRLKVFNKINIVQTQHRCFKCFCFLLKEKILLFCACWASSLCKRLPHLQGTWLKMWRWQLSHNLCGCHQKRGQLLVWGQHPSTDAFAMRGWCIFLPWERREGLRTPFLTIHSERCGTQTSQEVSCKVREASLPSHSRGLHTAARFLLL